MTHARPKIIYMGSPFFAGELLEFIIEEKLAEVCEVWTAPRRVRSSRRNRNRETTPPEPTPVGKVAQALGIPLYEPETLGDEAITRLTKLTSQGVVLALIVAYGKILPSALLSILPYGMFNLHFSLLPRHRGASPITGAILHGDKETGITIQKIISRLDAGPIVLQQAFPNRELNYEAVLTQSLIEARHAFKTFFKYWEVIPAPVTLPLFEQDETQVTYCSKIKKTDTCISAGETALSLHRKMLAFHNWKGVYVLIQGVMCAIEEIKYLSASAFYESPEIKEDTAFMETVSELSKLSPLSDVSSESGPYLIRTAHKRLLFWFNPNEDLIEVLALKKTGKRQITAQDFINAYSNQFPLKIDLPQK